VYVFGEKVNVVTLVYDKLNSFKLSATYYYTRGNKGVDTRNKNCLDLGNHADYYDLKNGYNTDKIVKEISKAWCEKNPITSYFIKPSIPLKEDITFKFKQKDVVASVLLHRKLTPMSIVIIVATLLGVGTLLWKYYPIPKVFLR